MQPNKHRTWAEIDLGAIEHNYRVICEAAKAPVLCVVKADCYGHGAVPVANRLQSMGAPYFAVATVPEAVELRENGIEKPIIILGYIDAADMDTVAEYGITAPVYDEETAELLSAAAVRTGRDITVHYKLDTGMTDILRPSIYGAQHPISILQETPDPAEEEYIVSGHCCESGDILTPAPGDPEGLLPRKMSKAKIGDFCVIGGAGAYCSSMCTQNYNSYPAAAEVMLMSDGSIKLIRRRQTLAQILENEVRDD